MIDVPPSASPTVARAITTARKLIAGATSENTRRSYATGWRQLTAHAQSLGLEPLGAHPALIATFLGHLRDGGASAQTLGSRAAAIRFFHRQAGLASPTDQRVVRDLLEGARREDAGRDHGRATITAKRLAASIELQGPPVTPLAIRDRAIVLLTFASGRRRAEIAGLNIEDLDFGRPGFLIATIRKSKTDQGGAGQFVAIPRLEYGPCAVAAVEATAPITNAILAIAYPASIGAALPRPQSRPSPESTENPALTERFASIIAGLRDGVVPATGLTPQLQSGLSPTVVTNLRDHIAALGSTSLRYQGRRDEDGGYITHVYDLVGKAATATAAFTLDKQGMLAGLHF